MINSNEDNTINQEIDYTKYESWPSFENENQNRIMNDLRDRVISIWRHKSGLDSYTPHDESHCNEVQKYARILIRECNIVLNPMEQFLLHAAIWLHDVGMNYNIATSYLGDCRLEDIRERHEETSARFVHYDEQTHRCFTSHGVKEHELSVYINIISDIIKFHRSQFRIKNCVENSYIEDKKIRTRLLACILRLADTLHIDVSRFDSQRYTFLRGVRLSRISDFHWMKSRIASNVHLDGERSIINVTIEIPERIVESDLSNKEKRYQQKRNNNDFNMLSRRISSYLRESIMLDLFEVRETIHDSGRSNRRYFSDIVVTTHSVSGYNDQEIEHIYSTLRDLEFMYAENTSNVIGNAINNIEALCKMVEYGNDVFEQYEMLLDEMVNHLSQHLKDHPCHLGIRKIHNELKKVSGSLKDDEEITSEISKLKNSSQQKKPAKKDLMKDKLKKLADQLIKETEITNNTEIKIAYLGEKNEKNKKLIDRKCSNDDIRNVMFKLQPNKKSYQDNRNIIHNVFLYGLSQIVIKLLEKVADKNNVRLFVLECSPKRKHMAFNIYETNNGIQYAQALHVAGFSNIALLPDVELSSAIEVLIEEEEKRERLKKIGAIIESNSEDTPNKSRKIAADNVASRSMLLFGTNGIDDDFSCYHTSGHLTLAKCAKNDGISVYVITNKFKMMPDDYKSLSNEDKKELSFASASKKQRKGKQWLTGNRDSIAELEEMDIEVINYLEDRIPADLLTGGIIYFECNPSSK